MIDKRACLIAKLGARCACLFDRISSSIFEEDLAAAASSTISHGTSTLSSKTLNGRVEIVNHDLEPIPASGEEHLRGHVELPKLGQKHHDRVA